MVEKALLTTRYLLERRAISMELKLIDEDCDDVFVPTLGICLSRELPNREGL